MTQEKEIEEPKVIWHSAKKTLPPMSGVPKGELHFWYYAGNKKHESKWTIRKSHPRVHVRGIPMTWEVEIFEFDPNHPNKMIKINPITGNKFYAESEINSFHVYMNIAKEQASFKLEEKRLFRESQSKT